ncbi:MAG TPA: hypothetical protein DCP31_33060 [Cyanobacteria bacterium UBA8543]|nr:hypothetical protein [Cyanobacteria bacterium UBA8543]
MLEDFLSNSEEIPTISASSQAPSPSTPEREAVQILVIGSKQGVTNIEAPLSSQTKAFKC